MSFTDEMMDVRVQLMVAPVETLKELLELFGQQPKSTDRVGLVMEADKLFLAEMNGEVVATSLLAFKLTLSSKKTIVEQVKTEKDSPTTEMPMASSVKVHKDFKISGQIDSKSGISYTSLIRQMEARTKKGHSEDVIIDGVIRA